MGEIIVLETARLRLELFPAGGGAITRLARRSSAGRWVELMRPTSAEGIARREPLLMSCFPLVPYCDLVTGGGFDFGGVHYHLPRNHPGIADPIHGEGWISEWQSLNVSEHEATLELNHRAAQEGFPFAYTASLRFLLGEDRLLVGISVRNDDPRPMPAGIGIHPYFQRTSDTMVRVNCARVWPAEAVTKRLPAIPVPSEWDFRAPRTLGEVDLDNSFAWWDCRYDIEWRSERTRLTVTADPIFRNLLIFVPKGGDHFCMEPISNAMDAFNLAHLGIEGHNVSVVQPGHVLTGEVLFQPGDITE